MMFRTAIVLMALAAPVFAQHGGHAGSFGGRSFAGHAGFSGSPGFSRSLATPAPGVRYGSPSARYNLPAAHYGAMGRAGFRGALPPRYSGLRVPYNSSSHIPYSGNRFGSVRAPYHRAGAGRDGDGNRGRDDRRRSFNNWYTNYYPTWLGYGYPYVFGSGFDDWGDSDTSGYDSS
ncbi:MAG: hypothetical protein WBP85_18095, partial [Terracidiphilus sp.]